MNITGNMSASIEQMSARISGKAAVNKTADEAGCRADKSFGEYMDSASVRFSKHANERLNTRNTQMARLEKGMSRAKEKGMKDPLVMVDNIAFIVNIKSNTVVTAVNDVNEAVFTNIDGAVIS